MLSLIKRLKEYKNDSKILTRKTASNYAQNIFQSYDKNDKIEVIKTKKSIECGQLIIDVTLRINNKSIETMGVWVQEKNHLYGEW
jgi:hypothetical protein